MFRKSFCKNFPISLSTRSLHSPTTLEQIQPNQSKAKFCAVGAIEALPVNPKSQPRKNKILQQSSSPTHQVAHQTHQTTQDIHEATVNPPP